MKKPVIAALCCFLALGTATAAFAEGPTPTPAPELVELSPEDTAPQFYPDSISWQEDGGQMLVIKQYNVPYDTAVADLTESGMQWGGSDYTLWGVTQSVEGGVTEEKEVTQVFELSVRSADAETARNDVKESVAYDDEYGFSGSLTLQDMTIGDGTLRRNGHPYRSRNRALHTAVRPSFCACGGCCGRKWHHPCPVDYGDCLRIALYRGAADYHPPAAQRTLTCGRTRKAHHCAESLCTVRGHCPWR